MHNDRSEKIIRIIYQAVCFIKSQMERELGCGAVKVQRETLRR
jgi:hypothetical protein